MPSAHDIYILDHATVDKKICRMAWEIQEKNYHESSLCWVGLNERGFTLAKALLHEWQKLCKELPTPRPTASAEILHLSYKEGKVYYELNNEWLVFSPEAVKATIKSRNFMLIDDVLNSGKTLLSCMSALSFLHPQKIEVAVLIERFHKTFPITATYSGHSLSTTLNDFIEVNLGENKSVLLKREKITTP